MIGATEIILISGVILLIFGGKKLPELMKGMGKGVKSFKEGMNEPTEEEMNRRIEEEIQRRADAEAARISQEERNNNPVNE
ncbi:MAG: twin-arginine translocase TatA/TatE family subunit [Muribaculaceae bacterium]|nr:twin-arginine translocase TatA/TatE family subunit [Muribaculaceae bacterium]MDE7081961.1 twin-arginine translocase TatA/TatE family subunit [Muribaculaceae bacterium]